MLVNGRETRDRSRSYRKRAGMKERIGFLFSPNLEDSVGVLRSFDSIHVRVLHEIFMFSSIKSCVPKNIFKM